VVHVFLKLNISQWPMLKNDMARVAPLGTNKANPNKKGDQATAKLH